MNQNSPHPPISPTKSPKLSPRSQIVLLKCMKPSNGSASVVPLAENTKQKTIKKNGKMEEILLKENIRATRSKRKEILTQQLVNKLGRNQSEKISKHVDLYLDKHVEISSDSLETIEKSIKEDQGTSQIQIPEPLNLEPNSSSSSHHPPETNTSPTTTAAAMVSKLPPGEEWKKLAIFQTLQAKDTKTNENNNKIERTQLLSNELLQQIQLENERKRKEREEKLLLGEAMRKESEKYHQECEKEKLKHVELNKKTKLMWDEQLSLRTQQKQLQKTKEMNEKVRTCQEREEEIERIEQENLQRKLREEKRCQLIKKEYEDKKKEKQLLRMKEKEDDKRMTIEAAKEFEREENKRKKQFQDRLRNIENRSNLAEDGPLRLSQEEEMRENELILRHIQERNDLERKLFEEKKQRTKQLNKEINETNLKLMSEKFARMNEERTLEREMGEQSKRAEREAVKENQLELERKRLQQQQYREELLKQIKEQSHQQIVLQRDMTIIERSLNAKDLQLIEKDPNTSQKVAELFSKTFSKRGQEN